MVNTSAGCCHVCVVWKNVFTRDISHLTAMRWSVAADLLWTQTFSVVLSARFCLRCAPTGQKGFRSWPGSCTSCLITSHLLFLTVVYSSPLSSHLVLIFCSFLSFSRLLSRHCLLFQLSFSSHPLVFGLFLLSFPLSLLFFILTLSFSLPVFPPFSLSVFNVSSPTLLPSDLLFHLLPYAHLLFLFPRLFILSSFLLLQKERERVTFINN